MSDAITVDEAEDIVWSEPIARQVVSKHRWYTKQLIVFERDDELWGLHYLDPASEEQDGQERFTAVPVPIFRVQGREVTTTVYEVIK